MTRPTRVTDQTATLTDHIITNSPDLASYLCIIDLGLFDHDLIYCTRNTYLPKSHKHSDIFVYSVKKLSAEKYLENLGETFP